MEGEERLAEMSPSEMAASEIVRIANVAAGLGISRVKLTGGEPLVRKEITEIVSGIAAIPALIDLSMTTNGTLLAPLARKLRTAGLRRVNISLPTLHAETYSKLTGGRIEDALEGVKAAVTAGFYPVKLNMLVLRCVNDYDFQEMLGFARETGTILQLIELEPININDEYYVANHKSLEEYEDTLKRRAVKTEVRKYMQNRRIYHLPDVRVEVIHPTENTQFCAHCTRLRVTSDGKLKPCLMRNDNLFDIITPMRRGATDQELEQLIKLANHKRQPYNVSMTEAA